MKKTISLLCIAILLFTLTACSKEDKVIVAIDNIGEVTLSSSEAIQNAKSLYDALDDSVKANVTNYEILEAAEKEYKRQAGLISDAINAVNNIGTVTAYSGDIINAAYDALTAAYDYDVEGGLEPMLETYRAAYDEYNRIIDEIIANAEDTINKANDLIDSEEYGEAGRLFAELAEAMPDEYVQSECARLAANALLLEARTQLQQGNVEHALEMINFGEKYVTEDELIDRIATYRAMFEALETAVVPENGEFLNHAIKAGRNTFEVSSPYGDALLKIESVEDPAVYDLVYIKAGEKAKFNIVNGEYKVKYTAGPVWYGEEYMFGPDATFYLYEDTIKPAGYTSGDYIHWHELSVELNTGFGEDYGGQNIDPAEF